MTEDDGRISRRRVLGALSGIGAAGAFGGGTSALLWDEEVFGSMDVPNVFAAGNLNLQVDWTEHYADWKGSETTVEGVRMVDGPEDLRGGETGLPTPENPMVAVPTSDTDGDGTAQITEFMDKTVTESSGMTDNPDPIITLKDVKPGDFGEVTLSYHVQDNPAYVSLCADVPTADNELADADNGYTEPEDAVDGDADNDDDGTDGGDLGEHVQATAWYDPDCNNRFGGEEVEVMLVTDVSESMSDELPGAPANFDGQELDATRLEAVRGAVGDDNGFGLLSALEESCSDGVEVGAVSGSEDLHHLDNLDDGDDADSPAGFDDGSVNSNLDKALGPVGGSDYDDVKKLFASGTDFAGDFVVDDPINNGSDIDGNGDPDKYEAERPYTTNGDSTQARTVVRAHRALLPDGTTAPSGRTGIDPDGNAAAPGDARKLMVIFVDGAFSAEADDPIPTAKTLSSKAEQDDIGIIPVIVNESPSALSVKFADELSTPDTNPLFATQYETSPSECDSDVTDAGYTCRSLVDAMKLVQRNICATAGAEQRIAGPASLDEVLSSLDDCVLLDPMPAGSTVDPDFGSPCTATDSKGCVALAWWLPRDIPGVNDNIVQTDKYEFTVGFQATQCRHNSGDDKNTTKEGADAEA